MLLISTYCKVYTVRVVTLKKTWVVILMFPVRNGPQTSATIGGAGHDSHDARNANKGQETPNNDRIFVETALTFSSSLSSTSSFGGWAENDRTDLLRQPNRVLDH